MSWIISALALGLCAGFVFGQIQPRCRLCGRSWQWLRRDCECEAGGYVVHQFSTDGRYHRLTVDGSAGPWATLHQLAHGADRQGDRRVHGSTHHYPALPEVFHADKVHVFDRSGPVPPPMREADEPEQGPPASPEAPA